MAQNELVFAPLGGIGEIGIISRSTVLATSAAGNG